MAKKLRKVQTPLWVLFVQLLIPWIVMGIVAVLAALAGAPSYAVFLLAIGGALAVTYAIHRYGRGRTAPRRRGRT